MASLPRIDKAKFGPWAIVTGASSGIGKEFAKQIASSGINVVLVARRLELLETFGQELVQAFNVQYRAIGLDLMDENFIETLEDATHDLDLGLVVSCFGVPLMGEFLTHTRHDLIQSVQLKVIAHLSLAHHFGSRLAQHGHGGLLLVSSIGGLQGIPHVASTAAAEAYVLSLGEALHIEFKKHGVNVTVLLPGPTDTPAIIKQGISADDMPMKPMSTQQCVSEGLTALNANRATHVAGRMNRMMARLMPRAVATRIMGNMMNQLIIGKGQ